MKAQTELNKELIELLFESKKFDLFHYSAADVHQYAPFKDIFGKTDYDSFRHVVTRVANKLIDRKTSGEFFQRNFNLSETHV